MKIIHKIFIIISLIACNKSTITYGKKYFAQPRPNESPIPFKADLIPDGKLIHKGILSPDLSSYYFTVSDPDFKNFDIYSASFKANKWTTATKASINSNYNDHGMSFSPDGATIYFSSTRPVKGENIADTWHIWKSEKTNDDWSEAVYVDIPNMRNKLTSHPSVSELGKLYFHASNLDYSEMDLYESRALQDTYQSAVKVEIQDKPETELCTPFVSPKEDYLIYASIDNQLDLWISYKDNLGNWANTKRLNDKINNHGQGNPHVSSDNNYLFYTIGEVGQNNWNVMWVRFYPFED